MVGYSTINSWPHLLPPLSDPHVLQIAKAKGRTASQVDRRYLRVPTSTYKPKDPIVTGPGNSKGCNTNYILERFATLWLCNVKPRPCLILAGSASLGAATWCYRHPQGPTWLSYESNVDTHCYAPMRVACKWATMDHAWQCYICIHLDFRPLPWNASVRTHSCWTLSNLVLEFAKAMLGNKQGRFLCWTRSQVVLCTPHTFYANAFANWFCAYSNVYRFWCQTSMTTESFEAVRCSDVGTGWTRHAQRDDTRQDAAALEGGHLSFGDLRSLHRAEDFLGGTMRYLIPNDYSTIIPKPPWRCCTVWLHI